MSTQPAILVYGHDRSLLDTRAWVLEHAGYRVALASERSELQQVADSQPIDLLVLCHTLTPDECEQTLDTLRRYRPAAKKLFILSNGPFSPGALWEPGINAFDGPRALIAMVGKVLAAAD